MAKKNKNNKFEFLFMPTRKIASFVVGMTCMFYLVAVFYCFLRYPEHYLDGSQMEASLAMLLISFFGVFLNCLLDEMFTVRYMMLPMTPLRKYLRPLIVIGQSLVVLLLTLPLCDAIGYLAFRIISPEAQFENISLFLQFFRSCIETPHFVLLALTLFSILQLALFLARKSWLKGIAFCFVFIAFIFLTIFTGLYPIPGILTNIVVLFASQYMCYNTFKQWQVPNNGPFRV